jgi:hypothetical protein
MSLRPAARSDRSGRHRRSSRPCTPPRRRTTNSRAEGVVSKKRSTSRPSAESNVRQQNPGISNRESARDESAERAAHPPVDSSALPPEDAAGRVGEQPTDDQNDLQTSRKAGSRSTAQKETASRYPDRSMPASKKVPGAFGKEPKDASSGEELE